MRFLYDYSTPRDGPLFRYQSKRVTTRVSRLRDKLKLLLQESEEGEL